MATAPDMFETLEWILNDEWNGGPGSWAHVQRRIEAILAKARRKGVGTMGFEVMQKACSLMHLSHRLTHGPGTVGRPSEG